MNYLRFELVRPFVDQAHMLNRRSRVTPRNASVLTVLLALAGCDNSCVIGAVPTDKFTKAQQSEMKVVMPWAKHAQTCRIAGYIVMGPTDGSSGEIVVTRDGTSVLLEGPRQIHVQSPGGSLVSIQDLSGAGQFDWISYSAIDPADGLKYTITDADADGRLDTKIGDNAGFANINGEWARFEKRGDQLGAVVAGEWRPLEKHGRNWQVQSK
jgi:hypothetical protein